ncbi:MAG: LemA protein [Lentisphaeria bacterium]|jgi:LemA protein
MSTTSIVFLVIVVALALYVVSRYNALVKLKNRYKNGFSQIEVQLKRRYDLTPNLVEIAKGYIKHERETLEAVISARNAAVSGLKAASGDPGNASNHATTWRRRGIVRQRPWSPKCSDGGLPRPQS